MAQESTPEGSPPLTLDEAINLAQANNRQVKNTILTAAIDEEQILYLNGNSGHRASLEGSRGILRFSSTGRLNGRAVKEPVLP